MNLSLVNQILPDNNEDILVLKKQIFKDFSPFTEFFPDNYYSDNISCIDIIKITKESLEYVLNKNQQSFMQILNRIDIDEKTIKKIFLNKDFIECLLYEVLKKECSKIMWRKKFN